MSAPGLAARVAAAALLAGVLERDQSLSDQISDAKSPLARLEPGGRARAQSLASGTLRHLGRIDAMLAGYLKKTPPPPAMNALRLAVAEMYLDGIPAHAAVDGAVRLTRASGRAKHLSGLVNAVARRVAAGGRELWDGVPEAAMPGWLAMPVEAEYGAEAVGAINSAHLRDAVPLDLTLKDAAQSAAWSEALGAEVLPGGSLRLQGRNRVSGLPGYEEGAWWVQDAAAAVPARLLGDVHGRKVLDVCAAPGGKTMQLAAAGASVVALDISKPRLARLSENLKRTGLEAEVIAADALAWDAGGRFDAILLDAPCSATGTIRRHPDIPFVRRDRDLRPLLDLQAALLDRTWRRLAPGGRLVYCTCSLFQSEGEQQVAAFLERTPDARQICPDPFSAAVDEAWMDAAGGVRLRPDYWADKGGMDGFYAALIEKPAHSE